MIVVECANIRQQITYPAGGVIHSLGRGTLYIWSAPDPNPAGLIILDAMEQYERENDELEGFTS